MASLGAFLDEKLAVSGTTLSSDDLLFAFVDWCSAQGLELYTAQEEAILELLAGKHVILNTPTGSGKSLVATALAFFARARGKRLYYTCPIKALVNEKFFALCGAFGADSVGMLTGDASVNRDAPIICCTAEILSNVTLRDPALVVDYVVMDEFHYYGDKERGIAWQIPLLALKDTTFLLMSATLGDTKEVQESLHDVTGKEVALVLSGKRPVPLYYEYRETPLHETITKLVEQNRAPIYLVNFSQRAAAEQAQNLMSIDITPKADKERIRNMLAAVKFDSPYGKEFQRFIRHGIGVHHAGLLPKYRLLVEKLAQEGLLRVVSGTDTLGVGVNIPIRTVLFTQLYKFDGTRTAILSAREFHQIAGRAGRKGFDDAGYVVVEAPEHEIENLKLKDKKAQGKKVVMQKPTQKGYVHWDRATFARLCEALPEPLVPQYHINHGMVMHALQTREAGYRRLIDITNRAHIRPVMKRNARKHAAVCFRSLRAAGLVSVFHDEKHRHAQVALSPDLQDDFSLNQTLSLYLVETLKLIDRERETYAFDVLSLVESILENPHSVLFAQVDRKKSLKMAEMKAAGVEYDERIAELDKIEFDKPLADFVYATFNEFLFKHPWVATEHVKPKSVARELLEKFCSFNDYIGDYGLERSEGQLLRYLSDTYKTLAQTVPESMRTEQLEDLIEQLRLTVRDVDFSLVDEWESMRRGLPAAAPADTARAPVVVRTTALSDFARKGRIRAELHAIVRALGLQKWDDALARIAPNDADGNVWTAERLEQAMAPFFAEEKAVDITPRGRAAHLTTFDESADELHAQQKLLAPDKTEDEADFLLEVTVPSVDDAAKIRLDKIGR